MLHIKELDIGKDLNSEIISSWLRKHRNTYKSKILSTACGKWQKYLYMNEMPYPCCCSIKEEDCIFTELYYNLEKLIREDEPELFYINNIIKRTLKNFK